MKELELGSRSVRVRISAGNQAPGDDPLTGSLFHGPTGPQGMGPNDREGPFLLEVPGGSPQRDTIAVCAWEAAAILSLWIAVFRQHHNPFLQKHSFLL